MRDAASPSTQREGQSKGRARTAEQGKKIQSNTNRHTSTNSQPNCTAATQPLRPSREAHAESCLDSAAGTRAASVHTGTAGSGRPTLRQPPRTQRPSPHTAQQRPHSARSTARRSHSTVMQRAPPAPPRCHRQSAHTPQPPSRRSRVTTQPPACWQPPAPGREGGRDETKSLSPGTERQGGRRERNGE